MITDRNAFSYLTIAGLVLVGGFIVLALLSWRFGYDFDVPEMPILAITGLLVVMGVAYGAAAYVIARAGIDDYSRLLQKRLLFLVILVGVTARLSLVSSTPILEDDYQRYLWDGAVTASGHNPYSVIPGTALKSGDGAIRELAKSAGQTIKRVNYPRLRTLYPAGAQAFFALAHTIKPFSRGAWQAIVMVADGVTFALLLLLLHHAGRPLLWSLLYWWNPVVIKELVNSLHMEAVLMPFVLSALLLAIRKRPFLAATAIGLAGAIKVWPLVLFPVLIRAASNRPAVCLWSGVLVAGITVLWMAPIVLAGLDQTAGMVAYAGKWRTNGAFFTFLLWLWEFTGLSAVTGVTTNLLGRCTVVIIVAAAGTGFAIRHFSGPADVISSVAAVTFIIFLVSPAQFPWYVVWIVPFLAFVPLPGLIFLAVTMPLYYVAFYLMAIDRFALFNGIVIWMVWCPVWALLIIQGILHGPVQRGRAAAAISRRSC